MKQLAWWCSLYVKLILGNHWNILRRVHFDAKSEAEGRLNQKLKITLNAIFSPKYVQLSLLSIFTTTWMLQEIIISFDVWLPLTYNPTEGVKQSWLQQMPCHWSQTTVSQDRALWSCTNTWHMGIYHMVMYLLLISKLKLII